MGGIALALGIVQVLNAASPGIAQLITLILHKDGSISVAAWLDESDAKFSANIQQAADWLKAHPKG